MMAWVRLKATSDGVIISKRRVNAAGSDGFSVPSMRKISSKFDTTFVMTRQEIPLTIRRIDSLKKDSELELIATYSELPLTLTKQIPILTNLVELKNQILP